MTFNRADNCSDDLLPIVRSFALGRSPLAATVSADRRHSASKLAELQQKSSAR
jgi:hypothetical protein